MRVADKAHYFTILEQWRQFLKVLWDILDDNNSGMKKRDVCGGGGEILTYKIMSLESHYQ